MSDKIVDLNERRNAAERPDEEHVRKDDFGRPLYEYLLDYAFSDGHYSTTVWAYSADDAQARVSAMRASLEYKGQLFAVMPA